jgi:putative membrane-bound dehydrogenase-like protein
MLRRQLLLALTTLIACRAGLSVADDFPPPLNTEPLSEQTRLSPSAAAQGMILPAGFSAAVFAAEPDVQNPIAMAWDGRGRLWIAENYTYAQPSTQFDLSLRDRVLIFDDTHRDRFGRRTVFTDDVQRLTSIEIGHGGVWLMCPPKLIFMADRDGNDAPDDAGEVVLDGFTVAKQNYHNFANGLRFGPDGWLYGRCGGSCPGRIGIPGTPDAQRLALEGGIWRYHPVTKDVEVLTSGTTNPWGHDWNDVGEGFFVNTVNGHLWHLIPGAHFARPFTLDPNPRVYEAIDFHADHWHFDTGQSWLASRAGKANSFGGGHAHQGAVIYQGTHWPRNYRNKLLTVNLHGLRVNQERLERVGGGYVAKHEPDFLVAVDPWFRGLDLSVGPDGNLFVIDWSDIGECHEHTGVHRTSGRIFKISYQRDKQLSEAPIDVSKCSHKRLITMAMSTASWSCQQARLELARRQRAGGEMNAVAAALRTKYDHPKSNSAQFVRGLLALHAIGAANEIFLMQQLEHPDPHVRVWAIRLLTERLPIDDALGPPTLGADAQTRQQQLAADRIGTLVRLASYDPSPLVRLTLASTLQRLPVSMRAALAAPLAAQTDDVDDQNIPLMIWYGLMAIDDHQLSELISVAKTCQIPTTLRLISRRLAAAAETNPQALYQLIEIAANCDDTALRNVILTGFSEGWSGWQRVARPAAWDQLLAVATDAEAKVKLDLLGALFGDGRSLTELTALALGTTPAPYPNRLSALQTLIQVDAENLKSVCEKLLNDPRMNVLAARGLAQFDDPEVGSALVARYFSFRAPTRPQLMSILVSRPSFAREMLAAIESSKIPRDELSAYGVRQIQGLGDPELTQLVTRVWGEVRQSPEAKQQMIDSLRTQLTKEALSRADKRNGRAVFVKQCQNCHKLYGSGETVGPDLTGGNRANLDYLLSNIIDPSAVVDKDFRMTSIVTTDGRLINGLVTGESQRTISIRTATEAIVVDKSSIDSRTVTTHSPMPDGLLEVLTAAQIRDLLAYLQHPNQVALAAED